MNKAFKKEAKNVREHFAKMDAKAIEDVKESLETNGEFLLKINGSSYRLIPDMVQVKQLQETLHMEEFVTNVTGASFDIDHIFYVIFEHNFRVRSDGDQKTVLNYHPFLSIFYFSPLKKKFQYLSLPPIIAPLKCSVLPLSTSPELAPLVRQLCKLRMLSQNQNYKLIVFILKNT